MTELELCHHNVTILVNDVTVFFLVGFTYFMFLVFGVYLCYVFPDLISRRCVNNMFTHEY